MATVQSLKKKLESIRSTAKITRAMKTASTVKYSKLSVIYAEYGRFADEHLRLYNSYKSEFNSVFTFQNPDAPCCYVVITSDKGMCGSFNTDLLSFFYKLCKAYGGVVIACGRKAIDFCDKKGIEVDREFVFGDIPSYEQVSELFDHIRLLMEKGKISCVKTVYPEYVNMISQRPVCRELFLSEEGGETGEEPVFVPDKQTVIRNSAEKMLLSVLYRRVLETALGAQAATLSAMRSAYDTAMEYCTKLEIESNRLRQSQVTADVIEISSEFSMEGDI